MSQKAPVSKHSKYDARGGTGRSTPVRNQAPGAVLADARPQPKIHFPVDEILCVHLQFTKLTSDSDVTSSSVHSPACSRDGAGWGARR